MKGGVQARSKFLVAFQGERGSFSFSAACKLLGSRVPVSPCESFKDVFRAVEGGTVTHAVIPIENTLHGSVHENYDRTFRTICEVKVSKTRYCLGPILGIQIQEISRWDLAAYCAWKWP